MVDSIRCPLTTAQGNLPNYETDAGQAPFSATTTSCGGLGVFWFSGLFFFGGGVTLSEDTLLIERVVAV